MFWAFIFTQLTIQKHKLRQVSSLPGPSKHAVLSSRQKYVYTIDLEDTSQHLFLKGNSIALPQMQSPPEHFPSLHTHTHINTAAITNRPSGLEDRKHFFPKYKVTSDIYLLNLLTDQYVMSAHSSTFREHHSLIQVNYPLKIISLATSVP